MKLFATILYGIYVLYDKYILQLLYKSMLGYCGKKVCIRHTGSLPFRVLSRMYLYDNTKIKKVTLISVTGKFIMKKNSAAATGLTVVTGNHQRTVGALFVDLVTSHNSDIEKDVIVEEDVWIGANVTLLAGTTIGRGANIGSGSVVRNNTPPYAIVVGNPAKIVGFCFTPEEIIEHEKALYPEEERIPLQQLEKNYQKYFLSRLKEIKEFTKL